MEFRDFTNFLLANSLFSQIVELNHLEIFSTFLNGNSMNTSFSLSPEWESWMIDIRRDLHRCPELSFQEFRTATYLESRLQELNIPSRRVALTGLVGWLGEENPAAPCIALRADMDALPLQEETGLPFASINQGVMHACGHDGHMAMLLGAASLLKDIPLPGKVLLIFQPAEEKFGGACRIIEEGILDGVDAIYSGHLDRHFNTNEIAVEAGLICAHTDSFSISIKGRGGHAGKPHETIDAIVVASLLVMSIQTLVSREINPVYPSVVSVGRIEGGTANNVIAEQATLEGTIRTTHEEVRDTIINGLKRMVNAMRDLYNAEAVIDIRPGYPPIINTPDATALARKAAIAAIGEEMVRGLPTPSMGGEDFAYYLEKIPGCFVRLGGAKKGLENISSHSSYYDFDEEVIRVGSVFMTELVRSAIRKLKRKD
jgi:amidohydrolase